MEDLEESNEVTPFDEFSQLWEPGVIKSCLLKKTFIMRSDGKEYRDFVHV